MSAQAHTKRSRHVDEGSDGGGQQEGTADSEERAVRQRTSCPVHATAHTTLDTAVDAAANEAVAAFLMLHARLSLMRLAVVERQLIMQALDFTSLARLASTCSQLRAEAVHREAGKFISYVLQRRAVSIQDDHPAHASLLFRKHAPMTLNFENDLESPAKFEALMAKAATFSRVADLDVADNGWWTDDLALRVLSLPCMQAVRRVELKGRSWIKDPRVQIALFGLPQLEDCDVVVHSTTTRLPGAVALASHLQSVSIEVDADAAASIRAYRALRLVPALTTLQFIVEGFNGENPEEMKKSVLGEIVCCLPPTLKSLSVWELDFLITRNLPRPLSKALFSRTPMLESLELTGSVATILRGLLDAGLRALPRLRQLTFRTVTPFNFSFDQDPDPIPPLLRRFLHRFPQVTVRLNIEEEAWDEPGQLSAVQARYQLWPRVEVYSMETDAPIGGPPSPHASDDEQGSDVDEWLDPHPLESEADSAQSAN